MIAIPDSVLIVAVMVLVMVLAAVRERRLDEEHHAEERRQERVRRYRRACAIVDLREAIRAVRSRRNNEPPSAA